LQPDFLKMAVECAEAARDAFDNGHHDSAVNRSYYAMFNAARAWLSSLGRPIDGKHGAVIGEFGLHVVRPGLIEADFGRAFETRNDADYGEPRLTIDDVRTTVEKAEAFVDRALAALAGRIHTDAAARGPSASAWHAGALWAVVVPLHRPPARSRPTSGSGHRSNTTVRTLHAGGTRRREIAVCVPGLPRVIR